MKPLPLVSGLVLLLGAGFLRAELTWDTRRIELTPTPFDAAADAKFGFVNNGAEPVTIESVKSSCGCTIPTLEKKTYVAGERGEILARYNIGDRRGTQLVGIQVGIQGERVPLALTLVVRIPNPVSITPTMLAWTKGEPNAPKTITVQAVEGLPIRVEKVVPSTGDFEVKIEMIKEAAEYHIVVTPKSTDRAAIAMLNIDTLLTDKKKLLQAYAQVRAPIPRSSATTGLSFPPARTPPIGQADPALLVWEKDGATDPKTIIVRLPAESPAKVMSVAASSENFDTRVETVQENIEYRIIVTPKATTQPGLAVLTIQTSADSTATPIRAYAQVRVPRKR